MITVQLLSGLTATWDHDARTWHCENAHAQRVLRQSTPMFSVGTPFLTGGCQKVALDAAREWFPRLKVLKRTPEPISEDELQQ